DTSKIYAMGFSNGASIAASVMLLHPGTIAGGLLLRPRAIIEPAELPELHEAPVMLLAGEHDDKMPAGAGEHLARLLVRAGASVEFGIADAGHDLTPRDFAAGKGWFTKVLGG